MVPKVLLLLPALVLGVWLLRWGWDFLRALGAMWFFLQTQHTRVPRWFYSITVKTAHYPHNEHEVMPYRVYRPVSRESPPAVVIFHGATPHGEEHPVLDNLARALSHAGFLVFIPRLPKLKEVIIDGTNMASMTAFYRYLQGCEGVSPNRISLIGTSFAGGLMLKAFLDSPAELSPPRVMATYGTYCDQETTLRFALSGKIIQDDTEVAIDPDHWGQIIFFYNFLDQIPGAFNTAAIREVLALYVQGNTEQGDMTKAELPDRERRLADLFLTPTNPESRALAEEILEQVRPRLEAISPAHFYKQIRFPIWVFHGRNDTMVPYTEALALKRLMPRQVRLHISNVYSHNQLAFGEHRWRTVRDVAGLLFYMGRLFHAMEGRW